MQTVITCRYRRRSPFGGAKQPRCMQPSSISLADRCSPPGLSHLHYVGVLCRQSITHQVDACLPLLCCYYIACLPCTFEASWI